MEMLKGALVDRCEQIKAFHQREERYQGLQLEYEHSMGLKEEILGAFETVKLETGLQPQSYEDVSLNRRKLFCIEFHDEYDREGGRFFSSMLHHLGIDKCAV